MSSDKNIEMDTFMAPTTTWRRSSIRTPLIFPPENDGKELKFLHEQDVTNLSLTIFPNLEISSETLPTTYGEYSKVNKKYSFLLLLTVKKT